MRHLAGTPCFTDGDSAFAAGIGLVPAGALTDLQRCGMVALVMQCVSDSAMLRDKEVHVRARSGIRRPGDMNGHQASGGVVARGSVTTAGSRPDASGITATITRQRRVPVVKGLLLLCIALLATGDASFAAEDVAGAPRGNVAAEADLEIDALLHTVEQQVSAGRFFSPEHDNAIETWSRVIERSFPPSPGILRALADFATSMRNRAAEEKQAGSNFWLDYKILADYASKLVIDAGNSSAVASAGSPAVPASAAATARPSSSVASAAVADLPKAEGDAAKPPTMLGSPAASDAAGADMNAARPAPTAGSAALAFGAASGRSTTRDPTAPDQSMAALYARRGDEMLAIRDISAARRILRNGREHWQRPRSDGAGQDA